MGKGGKGGKRKTEVYRGPLGKWGALFSSRGNALFRLEAAGPTVKASNPEELRERTAEAQQRVNPDEPIDSLWLPTGRQARITTPVQRAV